ncbi:MAG: cupin domain-containing protein [Chitinophagaceae bacterium]|nr:cupin domain-containing protein [Chitinophagaceae bacterium]
MPFIDFNTRKKIILFPGISGPVYHSEQLTFGHFTLEEGVELPAHSHVHEQWTHVIEGAIEFSLAGEKMLLTPGMAAFIPSNTIHSAKAILLSKVIDCFMPVREDFREKEKVNEAI